MMSFLETANIENKKVLIRVDFNIPIVNAVIQNDFRLKATKPTIDFCLNQNCSIILMSHLGRPQGFNEQFSMEPIVDYLIEEYNVYVHYSKDCISSDSIEISNKMLPREIHLLDNLRFYNEETLNDIDFSEKLSKHADIYINDAFGISHREHSSNNSILKFYEKKYLGFLMKKELKYLTNLKNSEKLCVIIGGAKISTKIKMIYNYLGKANDIIIGGAMSFTFIKSMGYEIGKSLYEEDMLEEAKNILKYSKELNTKIHLPVDIVSSTDVENLKDIDIFYLDKIPSNHKGLDIGPETSMNFSNVIHNSMTVIWNGPMGVFEKLEFATGTQSVCNDLIEKAKDKNFISIIGGGDTVNAIESYTSINNFTHVSTGGGASLKLLSGEKLKLINSMAKK